MKLRLPFSQSNDVQALVEELAAKDATIRELMATCAELKQTVARQAEEISELRRRLGLNSRNSSKPPSSDGLGKPPAPKRDNVKGRKPGGQKGHKGNTLLRSEVPDHVINHVPHGCTHCGHTLDEGMSVRVETRQVHDIPDPSPLIVSDHVAHTCLCPHCKLETVAPFPEGVNAPVQYGPNLVGLAVYLSEDQLIPVKRLVRTFRDVFGVVLSQGTIVNMISRTAGRYRGFAGTVREAVAGARVVHMDETGIRIEDRLHWLHVACTRFATHLRIGKSRGDIMTDARGFVVHDCMKSYFNMKKVKGHGICCVHLLRELEDLSGHYREKWAEDLAKVMSGAVHKCNLARGSPLCPDTIREIGDNYDRIVEEGFRYHESLPPLASSGKRGRKAKRKGHNLLLRLREHREGYLLFTRDPRIPATNNLAENALRMEKVKQKISGCHRSMEGAINRAIIRSVLATARKQGWNILDTLRSSPEELVEKLVAGPLVDTEPIT